MFRVTFMTDDKRLGEALKALVGIAAGAPEIAPLHDAKLGRNGKVSEDPLLPFGLAQQLPHRFKTADVAVTLKRLGRPCGGNAVNKKLNEMLSEKLIRKVSKRGSYERVKRGRKVKS